MPQSQVDMGPSEAAYCGWWVVPPEMFNADVGRLVCDQCEVGWVDGPNCWMCGRFGHQSTWWTFQYKRCGARAT